MKKKIICLLLAAVMLMSMSMGVFAANGSDLIKAEPVWSMDGIMLKLTAVQATTNGKLKITYNSDYLSYVSTDCDATVYSVKADDGVLTFGYAVSSKNAIGAGETIAVFHFNPTGKWVNSEMQLTIENFNGTVGINATLPTIIVTNGITVIPDQPDPDQPDNPDTPDNPDIPDTPVIPDAGFNDVSEKDWFYDAVNYVVYKGYFKGMTEDEFGPNYAMTRAMFVTVLGRMAGIDTKDYSNSVFTDLGKGQYYVPYVSWAHENGIVKGTSDTTFEPNSFITREQMATILFRYADVMGYELEEGDESVLDLFADGNKVDGWAKEGVAWAISNGIINGTDKGIEPLAYAQRCHVAQIIYRFDELTK